MGKDQLPMNSNTQPDCHRLWINVGSNHVYIYIKLISSCKKALTRPRIELSEVQIPHEHLNLIGEELFEVLP